MAATGSRQDPFPAFRFEVRIDALGRAGFSRCSGLQLEIEVQDHAEGGLNTHLHKLIGRTKQTNLVLERGVVDRTVWDWFQDIIAGAMRRRGGVVVVHDETGTEDLATWEFTRAFPVKWSGPELNATQNAVATETFELAHEGLVRKV